MEGITHMLPWERHPYVPLFILLRLDPGFGVGSHQLVQTCTLLHPGRKQLPLQSVYLPRDHTMLVSCGPVATHLCLE